MTSSEHLRVRADEAVARMRTDTLSDWPVKLLRDLADAPIVDQGWLRRLTDIPVDPELSARELDVLRCQSHGLTVAMTADMLSVAVDTVKTHLKRARYKLGAKNAMHAVAEALRKGLID